MTDDQLTALMNWVRAEIELAVVRARGDDAWREHRYSIETEAFLFAAMKPPAAPEEAK